MLHKSFSAQFVSSSIILLISTYAELSYSHCHALSLPMMLVNYIVLYVEIKNCQDDCLSIYECRKNAFVPSSLNFCSLHNALQLPPIFPSAWSLSFDHDPLHNYPRLWKAANIDQPERGKPWWVCRQQNPRIQKVPHRDIFCDCGSITVFFSPNDLG